MNRRLILLRVGFFLVVTSVILRAGEGSEADAAKTPAVGGAASAKAPSLSPRFQEVRDRINALFEHRNAALPSFNPRFDPFRTSGASVAPPAATASPAEGVPVPVVAAASDVSLLQASVAGLKVSGIVEIGGKQHFVINSRPYKEGDVIQTHAQGVPVYLRIREINRGAMVLALNQAETTLKWPKEGEGPPR